MQFVKSAGHTALGQGQRDVRATTYTDHCYPVDSCERRVPSHVVGQKHSSNSRPETAELPRAAAVPRTVF